jgi:hypothetical protein
MSSPYTRPDWPQQQPPDAATEQPQPSPQSQQHPQSQPQWEDAHADPPTEPIPVVPAAVASDVVPSDVVPSDMGVPGAGSEADFSDAATQQWTMEPLSPPHEAPVDRAADLAADRAFDGEIDGDAPTQQWTMELPPAGAAQQAPPQGPPSRREPPGGPPPEPPDERSRSYEPPPPPPTNSNMKWIWAAAGVVVLGIVVAVAFFATRPSSAPETGSTQAAPTTAPTTEPVRGCNYPAQVLDLTGWNVTVPTPGGATTANSGADADADPEDVAKAKEDEKKAKEINQPELATFKAPPYFQVTPTCDSVAFRAPVNGITTSGSKYPRSELREMNPGGTETAEWSSSVGAHTFVVNEAFTALPQGKPNLVGVQIHDEDDDVSTFRLEGSNLYITEGDDTHHKLVTDKYVLGTRYEAKYIVSGDVIQAFYNGQLQTTMTKKFDKAYFKAGAYTQANCDDYTVQCNGSTYGETTVYSVHVEHS